MSNLKKIRPGAIYEIRTSGDFYASNSAGLSLFRFGSSSYPQWYVVPCHHCYTRRRDVRRQWPSVPPIATARWIPVSDANQIPVLPVLAHVDNTNKQSKN